MENIIQLYKIETDFKTINDSDFKKQLSLKIYSDTHDLNMCFVNNEGDCGSVFGLWLEIGEGKRNTVMADVSMDELELFAHSVLKHIEIIRRNYDKQIKFQTENGDIV